jgi:hypothetical protein
MIIGKAVPNVDAEFISVEVVGAHPTGISVDSSVIEGVRKITLRADTSAASDPVTLKIKVTYGKNGETSSDEKSLFVTVTGPPP